MSNDRMTEVRSVSQESEGEEERIFAFQLTQLIWLFLCILESLIALRIGLKLINANPESPIVAMIYGFTHLFLFPFEGMMVTPFGSGLALELSSLFAMLIFALIVWAVERTIWVLFYRPLEPVRSGRHSNYTTSERRMYP
jgi:hypothetical protein